MSWQLLEHCLAPDTCGDGTGCDNMTCIIITFRSHPTLDQSQPEDSKKRKVLEEEEGIEPKPEKNGNDSKKAKND